MSLDVGDIVSYKQDDDYYGIIYRVIPPDNVSKIQVNRYWVDWFDSEKPTWFYDYELIKVETEQCQNITKSKPLSQEAKTLRRRSNS